MLRFAYSVLCILILTTFFGLGGVALWPFDYLIFGGRLKEGRLPPFGVGVKYYWCRSLMWVHGLSYRLHGPGVDYIKHPTGCIYVANHQSNLDILAMVSFLPRSASFIAKKELQKIPVFGWAATAAGCVFIDRKKGTKEKSLDMATKRLAMGVPLIIYPEGTRSPDGKLGDFKRGAFVMAIDAQVPIVPIVVLNSRDLLPKGSLRIKPGIIDVYVDTPVSTKGLKADDRHDLSHQVRERIAKQLDQFAENRENGVGASAVTN